MITTKEAIDCINAIRVQMFNNGKESKWTESCDMAIEALKEQRPYVNIDDTPIGGFHDN